MTVVDLAEAREGRAKMQRIVGELGDRLDALACAQAERAFAVSGPLAAIDPAIARGVNQWVRRELLRSVRLMLRDVYKKGAIKQGVEQVSIAYGARLWALKNAPAFVHATP